MLEVRVRVPFRPSLVGTAVNKNCENDTLLIFVSIRSSNTLSVVQKDFHVSASVVALTIEYCFIVLKNKLKNFKFFLRTHVKLQKFCY